MSLVLQSSGGGSVTLEEPVTASNYTITVPAATGTMLTTASTGTVLQVVQGTYSTQVSSSSSTYADTGLTASITPKFSTSKILVSVQHTACAKIGSNTFLTLQLLRNSTSICVFETAAGADGGSGNNYIGACAIDFLDSPATTSSVSYKTQFRSDSNIASVSIGYNSSVQSITLMEIAA
jgi:hypothetical protein